MSNPLRGEITLTGESGKAYPIRLGTNALARMQEAFNEPTIKSLLNRLGKELKGGDFSLIELRRLVQASSIADITETEAGDLIDDCGLNDTLKAITESLSTSINPRKGSARKRNSADS